MNTVLNIDTSELRGFSKRLESLSKTALPNVVRKTLNDAAMDVKKTTMPESARVFTQRQANFFRHFSHVDFAKGHDINSMKASIGFTETDLKGANNYAIKDLEQQEKGGNIGGKSFIPLDSARTGKTNARNVRASFRLSQIKGIVNARKQKGKNKGEQFVRAVIKAGNGGFVLGSEKNGENILWRVESISQNIKSRKLNMKLTPLYDYSKSRSTHVNSTHFMQKASDKTTKKIERIFISNAEERFKRVLKK